MSKLNHQRFTPSGCKDIEFGTLDHLNIAPSFLVIYLSFDCLKSCFIFLLKCNKQNILRIFILFFKIRKRRRLFATEKQTNKQTSKIYIFGGLNEIDEKFLPTTSQGILWHFEMYLKRNSSFEIEFICWYWSKTFCFKNHDVRQIIKTGFDAKIFCKFFNL